MKKSLLDIIKKKGGGTMVLIQIGPSSGVEVPKKYSQIAQYLKVSGIALTAESADIVVGGIGVDVHALAARYKLAGAAALHDLCGAFVVFIYDRREDATFICRDVLGAYSLFISSLETKDCEGIAVSGQPLSSDCIYFPPGQVVEFRDGDILFADTLRPIRPCPSVPLSAVSARMVLSDLLRSVIGEKLQGVQSFVPIFEVHDIMSLLLHEIVGDSVGDPNGTVAHMGIADWRCRMASDGGHLSFDGVVCEFSSVFAPFLDPRVASFSYAVEASLSKLVYSD